MDDSSVSIFCNFENNQILTYEGCFGFHRVANASRLRVDESEVRLK